MTPRDRAEEEPELVPAGEPLPAEPEPDTEVAPVAESEPLAQTAADLEQLDVDSPRVAIVVSEHRDLDTMEPAQRELQRRDISSETRVMSADERPEAIAQYVENAQLRGIRVIIAGAGPAARLPMMITAHTELPVIGVPLTSQGAQPDRLDELLSDGATTPGEPVGWVSIDDTRNAAVLAARILGA